MHPRSLAMSLACSFALAAPALAQFQDRPKPAFELPRARERTPPRAPEPTVAWWSLGPDGTPAKAEGADQPLPDAGARAAWTEPLRELARADGAMLTLADGQRLAGEIGSSGDVAAWVSPWCAPRPLGASLDGIASITFTPGAAPTASDQDAIVLRNGDRIDGIVDSIDARTVTIDRGPSGKVTAELATVASITLLSQPVPPAGARVWIADGSVVDGPTVHWMGTDYLQLPGIAGSKTNVFTVPRRLVTAFRSDMAAVTALAEQRAEVRAPVLGGTALVGAPSAESRGRWPMGLAPIDVQGPVVAAFPGLPASCTLRAVVFRDATARAAGSPDLVIRQGGKEVLRRTLGPSDERVEIAVPLAGGALELELARTDGQLAGTFAVLERAMLVPR